MSTKVTLYQYLIAKGETEDQVTEDYCFWIPAGLYHYSLQLLNIGYLLYVGDKSSNYLAVNSFSIMKSFSAIAVISPTFRHSWK